MSVNHLDPSRVKRAHQMTITALLMNCEILYWKNNITLWFVSRDDVVTFSNSHGNFLALKPSICWGHPPELFTSPKRGSTCLSMRKPLQFLSWCSLCCFQGKWQPAAPEGTSSQISNAAYLRPVFVKTRGSQQVEMVSKNRFLGFSGWEGINSSFEKHV